MNTGQWRVLVLLLFLLGLEILRSPTLQSFFKSILTKNIKGQTSATTSTSTSSSTSKTTFL